MNLSTYTNPPATIVPSYPSAATAAYYSPVSMQGTVGAARPLEKPKKSECSIIIRDLSFFCNENHLKELITCYGPCLKVHICRSEEANHRSLLHAFAELTSDDDISLLIEELHHVLFMGRQMKIQRCHENPELKESTSQKVDKMGIQVYVRFESMEDRVHGLVNEERLRDVFSDCGDVEDAIIQRHSQNSWRQKGYGFIFFLTFEGAELALRTKNGFMYDNVYYTCEYTHKAKEKISAMIAAPDDYQFYSIGARNPNFTASAPYDARAAGNNNSSYPTGNQYHQVHEPVSNPYHPQVVRQVNNNENPYGRGYPPYRYEDQQQQQQLQQQPSWSQPTQPYEYPRTYDQYEHSPVQPPSSSYPNYSNAPYTTGGTYPK